jgi:glutamine amidotransferase
MKIAIIKYNAGNIHSVRLALQREGIEPMVTDDADQIRNADKVIFPGVGEARTRLKNFHLRTKCLTWAGIRSAI